MFNEGPQYASLPPEIQKANYMVQITSVLRYILVIGILYSLLENARNVNQWIFLVALVVFFLGSNGPLIGFLFVKLFASGPKTSPVFLANFAFLFLGVHYASEYYLFQIAKYSADQQMTGTQQQYKKAIEDGFDYYKILEISPNASSSEIKNAYRKKSLKYHPDKKGCGGNIARFVLLAQAYETLIDSNKRKEYDTIRAFFSSIPALKPVSNDCAW